MRATKDDTRHKLLEAGRELLVADGLRQVIDIRLTDVLELVGLTTGAAYNIWDSQDEYRHELAIHVAKNLEWADDRLLRDSLAEMPTDVPMDQWITAAGNAYFEAFVARWDYYILLQFWGVKNPDPELIEAIRQGYDMVHQRLVFLFQVTSDMYSLELEDPYTLDDMAVAATAICEGLAIRHRFEPERVTTAAGPLFSDLMLRFTRSMTTPK